MNTSGIYPVEYKVLVKPEEVEAKSAGGLFIPDSVKDKEKFARERGTLVAIGAIAFSDPDWLDYPRVGDKVLYDRYAGSAVKGVDGVDYRLINDKEIGAILRDNV
jgi:chaperonin GroES